MIRPFGNSCHINSGFRLRSETTTYILFSEMEKCIDFILMEVRTTWNDREDVESMHSTYQHAAGPLMKVGSCGEML